MKKALASSSLIIILLIISSLLIIGTKTNLFSTYANTKIKYAIPVMGSYKCEPIGNKYGIVINVPSSGALLSKETIGFYTNGISNIELKFRPSILQTLNPLKFSYRFGYQTCDSNGFNCGRWHYTYSTAPWQVPIDSINFKSQSLRVQAQELPIYLIGGWKGISGAEVSFDGLMFGLRAYSTTQDPAGKIICSTSCNLDCPNIGVRQKMVLPDTKKLDFYQSAPYFEYWNTIDYDINKQGGATIYNSRTNTFCFAGTLYKGKKVRMVDGTTIIYPDTQTAEYKQCCPGARISSTYSDLVCQNDYTWKVIKDSDKLTCMSDINCPNSGSEICQNKILYNGYHCVNKDSNGVGVCEKTSGIPVQCCNNNDCANDQVCNVQTHKCEGGSTLPVCGDGIVETGEECDDGNTISGDGCSSNCEIEVDFCKQHPNDPTCKQASNSNTYWYLWIILLGGLIGGLYSLFSPIPNKKLMILKTILLGMLGLLLGFVIAFIIKLIIVFVQHINSLLKI